MCMQTEGKVVDNRGGQPSLAPRPTIKSSFVLGKTVKTCIQALHWSSKNGLSG